MFKSTGILRYDPDQSIKTEQGKAVAPWWCILETGEGLRQYYQWWIKKYYNVQFEKTAWGSHLSVIRGDPPPNPKFWRYREGKRISFTYTNRIYLSTDIFFCIDAYSSELEDIREKLGYSRLPLSGFHITIGRINKHYSAALADDPFGLKAKQKTKLSRKR